MPFGQLVIGPPGSGKTTYCHGMQQYLRSIGRKVALVNLDPANDIPPYKPDVDVGDLVTLEEVMQQMRLGPNGGLVYCMDYLQQNLDWLRDKLTEQESGGATYFLFDCPGQVELFTDHPGFKALLDTLTNTWHYRLTAVHLVDAHLCCEPSKYISALLLSLNTMLHLELPHVNVLSKVDLLPAYGDLDFSLDFYTQVQDLSYLVRRLGDDPAMARFRKLSAGLCEVVEDYGLVTFVPLAVQDRRAMEVLLGYIDKANGAVYAALERPQDMPLPPAFVYGAAHRAADEDVLADLVERYVAEVQERTPAVHPQLQQEVGQQDEEEVRRQQQHQEEEDKESPQQRPQQQQQQECGEVSRWQQPQQLEGDLPLPQERQQEESSRRVARAAAPPAAKEPG